MVVTNCYLRRNADKVLKFHMKYEISISYFKFHTAALKASKLNNCWRHLLEEIWYLLLYHTGVRKLNEQIFEISTGFFNFARRSLLHTLKETSESY